MTLQASYFLLILSLVLLVTIVLWININEAVKSAQKQNNNNNNHDNNNNINTNINKDTISNYTNNIVLNNIIPATTTATSTISNTAAIKTPKKKIGYAITVTKDGHFVDGALVLGYSALKVHDASKGFHSEYDAELIAFVVPTVIEAR